MGRIIDTCRGFNGLISKVKLRVKASEILRPIAKLCLITSEEDALGPGFLPGGTCTPWGYEALKQGYEMRRQNNGYLGLFAKNYFSMLFEIRKHFSKSFFTSALLNDFLS